MTHSDIVPKLWALCDILRDDGINYSDYVTELVMLLFIKMEDERSKDNDKYQSVLPEQARWPQLCALSGINLLNGYRRILQDLSESRDARIAAIYADAQTRIREPRHLEQLITSLDQLDWFDEDKDGLGDLYEGLLEKNASESKGGAGQYFTPRPLIDAIVRVIRPQAGETIQDPAAGTGGFLIAADRYIKAQTDELYDLDQKARNFQKQKAFVGVELVSNTRRLGLMNCLLHGIEGQGEGAIVLGNTLGSVGEKLSKVDLVLSNPPFGTAKGGGGPTRDFTYKTSNKQLAFLQHIIGALKDGGRAAVVLPDNVLFESGIGTSIRQMLMNKCRVHTILRLPTGIFYAPGVKTNVLFFQKISEKATRSTTEVWVYDMRANAPKFGKRTPLTVEHFADFIQVYGDDANGKSARTDQGEQGRWRCFSREWIETEKADSLDILWLKDDSQQESSDLPNPSEIAQEIFTQLDDAMLQLQELLKDLNA